MPRFNSMLMLCLTLVVAVGVIGWVWLRSVGDSFVFQNDDAPLAMPLHDKIDHRFDTLTAWQSAAIPLALRFDSPMGSENSAMVYNAQKFWDMNDARGGHHTGDDLNGIGGMNTDFGDPVFAVADGLVIYAGEPSSGWGKMVIVAHKTSDGRILHSMYAHLERIDVGLNALVYRGKPIGAVGTAGGLYLAHLHFEMRESNGVDIGAGYANSPMNRLDPHAAMAVLNEALPYDLSISPLRWILSDERGQ
jgi:hypothetical protein